MTAGAPPQGPQNPGYPPGGYGTPPPGGGYGAPPGGGYAPPAGGAGGYGAPPGGGYGAPPGGGYGAPPGGGYGQPGPMGQAPMINPDAPYGIDPATGLPFSDKQKLVAGLLQIFLGTFGVGRFYTGHIGLGVAQFLVGWLTCGIWPLIDGVMMLTGKVTDAQGRPLRD
jgi:hypothetical protein